MQGTTLQKWYILFETSAGWIRIPDAWIPDNQRFTAVWCMGFSKYGFTL
jgi:hypothetical protein